MIYKVLRKNINKFLNWVEKQKMKSLANIKSEIERISKIINAPMEYFPTFGSSKRDGTPNIEIGEEKYYYLAYDRDVKCVNRETTELNRLLYWVFEGITFSMASKYAQTNRITESKSKNLLLSHQLELLEKLDPQWRKQRQQEFDEQNDPNFLVDIVLSKKLLNRLNRRVNDEQTE